MFDPETTTERGTQWWFWILGDRDQSLEDDEHSGRPSDADNYQLRALVEANPRTTFQELATQLAITTTSNHTSNVSEQSKYIPEKDICRSFSLNDFDDNSMMQPPRRKSSYDELEQLITMLRLNSDGEKELDEHKIMIPSLTKRSNDIFHAVSKAENEMKGIYENIQKNSAVNLRDIYPFDSQCAKTMYPTQTDMVARCRQKQHYKTELCERYLANPGGYCTYGEKCRFAHGVYELRLPLRHPRYKTEVCQRFHSLGHCIYGRRCDFIHDEDVHQLFTVRLQSHLIRAYRKFHPGTDTLLLSDVLALGSDIHKPEDTPSFDSFVSSDSICWRKTSAMGHLQDSSLL